MSTAQLAAPANYRASFFHSVRSEIRKLTSLRSFWATQGLMIGVYTLLMWPIGSSMGSFMGASGMSDIVLADAVTSGITFVVVFAIVQGALAVTSEYSSNTMRTTTLSDPKRGRSFFAKLLGVACATAVPAALMTVLSYLVMFVSTGFPWAINSDSIRALAMFWALLVLGAVLATGLGYIIRSTAGTITFGIVALFISPMVTFINAEWAQNLADYLPLSALQHAVTADPAGYGTGLSWSTAGLVMVGYTVVVCGLGLLRYSRSDT